jgi:transcriptional regulator with XRE-family HTH domain
MLNYGVKLKKELLARGLRFNYVAESVGIGPAALNKYLNGQSPLSEMRLRAICLTHDIPLARFGLRDYRK